MSTKTYALNTWHHIIGVCDTVADTLVLYIDGALAASDNIARNPFSATDPADTIAIGAITSASPGYFTGQIDDIRLYSYPLTTAQVRTVYNEGSAIRFGPLTGSP